MRRYLKLHVTIATNPKVARLSDRAYRAFIQSLVSAKSEAPEGEWATEDGYQTALGPLASELPALMLDDLIVREPDGRLRIRQWRYWQMPDRDLPAAVMPGDVLERRRAADRERSKRYRKRQHAGPARSTHPPSRSRHAANRDVEHKPSRDASRTKGLIADVTPLSGDHVSAPGLAESEPVALCTRCQLPIAGSAWIYLKGEGVIHKEGFCAELAATK